jgi:hypothetical protein
MLPIDVRTKEVVIHSRRQIIIAAVLAPLLLPTLMSADPAMARNGGHGDGSEGGRGGSDSGGKGGDKGDSGRGSSGDSGRGEARGVGRNSKTSGDDADIGQGRSAGNAAGSGGRAISVRHRNGIAEEVNARGRYVMRDAQGRTIINRAATGADIDRLTSFSE